MNLLVITQKVDINDDNLGFFHGWLEKFANNLEKVYVICLGEGKHSLPQNVVVLSLGKDRGASKLLQFLKLQLYLFQHLKDVDGVFAHMCPIYAIFSVPLTVFFRKKIFLWYAHGAVTFKLRIAEKLVHGIVTSSREGLRIPSNKVRVFGQGIDVLKFALPTERKTQMLSQDFHIVTLGRITPSKKIEVLISSITSLVARRGMNNIKFSIVGSCPKGSEYYIDKLKKLCSASNIDRFIEFKSGVPHSEVPKFLTEADLFIHASKTGSMDKAVLEAFSCGVPVISSAEAYRHILLKESPHLYFPDENFELLSRNIEYIMNLSVKDRSSIGERLRKVVVLSHNLEVFVKNIVELYKREEKPANVKSLIRGALKRKSITRTLMNHALLCIPELRGKILDLGATKESSSYFHFLRVDPSSKVYSCDLSNNAYVYADLEKEFPFGEGEFDYILCFNLLEHIFNFSYVCKNMFTSLKKGGILIGFTPFLLRIHNDPNDYFRYSGQALSNIFSSSGFEDSKIQPIGIGPLTAAYSQIESYIPVFFRPLFRIIGMHGDFLIKKIKPSINEDRYPLGYLFTCKK